MTLTTEQLRARAKFWREKAVEAKWESVSIAQDMLQNADAFDELAANREAQPVAELVYSSAMPRFIGDTDEIEGYRCWIHGETRLVPTMDQAYADAKAVCTAPPAPAVPDDYFGELVKKARSAADKAMRKFPQPNYVLNKVAEESGEVIKAVIHYTEGREEWANVEGEIIDNLAMLIRLVVEGDQVIGFTPPDACRAAMLAAAPEGGNG